MSIGRHREEHCATATPREAETVLRASLSSVVATVVDGVAYEALLFVVLGHYGIAAFAGALLGGVSNFSLNRHWVFSATEQSLIRQVARYAVVSGTTFLALRVALWVLIDVLALDARLAWLPAKVIAFLAISYPLQRIWVFRGSLA